eukprot:261386-Chlamydomonas_euryale.AAC.3
MHRANERPCRARHTDLHARPAFWCDGKQRCTDERDTPPEEREGGREGEIERKRKRKKKQVG